LRCAPERFHVREQSYPAARRVAQKVVAYFARHHAEFREGAGEQVASMPGAEDVEAIVDAVFWASLRPEEGYVPRITIAFLSPEQSVHPLRFMRPLRSCSRLSRFWCVPGASRALSELRR